MVSYPAKFISIYYGYGTHGYEYKQVLIFLLIQKSTC